MRKRWMALSSCLILLVSLGVAACGSDNKSSSSGGGSKTLTIYSSLPLQGTSRGQSEAVINGEKLAFEQFATGGKLGGFTLKYKSLDDSTAQNPGTADEAQTGSNARQAVTDKTTIFYLGEFNSGGTKVSLPILNKANIPQISPSNTYVGLTTDKPGSEPGEPAKYYPAGTRTYARVVPADNIQGAAVATTLKKDGCTTVDIWNDKSTYGAGVAKNVELSAKAQGVAIGNKQGTDKGSANYRSAAAQLKGDCFFWGGVTGENGVQVFKDVAAAQPDAKLYGPDGIAEASFSDPKKGGVPDNVGKRVTAFVATLPPDQYPAEGQKFFADYKAKYNVTNVDPYAIYGYATMALALDVLKRAGDKANDRAEVLKQLFASKDISSVLGTYSIDANGDTSLTDYAAYSIKGGALTFKEVIKAQ